MTIRRASPRRRQDRRFQTVPSWWPPSSPALTDVRYPPATPPMFSRRRAAVCVGLRQGATSHVVDGGCGRTTQGARRRAGKRRRRCAPGGAVRLLTRHPSIRWTCPQRAMAVAIRALSMAGGWVAARGMGETAGPWGVRSISRRTGRAAVAGRACSRARSASPLSGPRPSSTTAAGCSSCAIPSASAG